MYNTIIDKYYPIDSPLRQILIKHSRQVADKAVKVAQELHLDLDPTIIRTAAMLHDIGIFLTNAPDIECHGKEPYIKHGILGAEILRREGIEEVYARVAERHTGAGITIADIELQSLPLPRFDFCPETKLERLICYADKFYSKSGEMKEKDIERIRRSMSRHSQETLNRWLTLETEFYTSI